MRKILAASVGALVLAGGAAAVGVKERVVGTASAAGDYASAIASGSADNPSKLRVRVTSVPRQSVNVNWTVVCTKGFGAGSKSGQFTARTPTTRAMRMPMSRPDNCTVSAGGFLERSGSLRVVLLAG